MLILGIESSCDDLSMAVLQDGVVLSNVTASQIKDHRPYGGVVPEIASRKHLENLEGTLELALERSGKTAAQLTGLAVTYAPGLVGSLLVGLNFGKALALSLGIPFRGVHHIEAHLWSPFIEAEPHFPFMGLVVSGGHTHLYLVRALGSYEILGQTVDDAAGEAFDKAAKMMGLPYPGGPAIDQLSDLGNEQAFSFALPRVKANPLNTSFSGMKTAVSEHIRKHGGEAGNLPESLRADLAASFQRAVVFALQKMVERAFKVAPVQQLAIAGGVACNRALRHAMLQFAQSQNISLLMPAPKYCTDNGAMVASLGNRYLTQGMTSHWDLNAQARLPLDEVKYGT